MQLSTGRAGVLCVRPGNTRGDRPHHPGHVRGRAGGDPASACPHQPHVIRPPHPDPGGQRRQNPHGESDVVILPLLALTSLTSSALRTCILEARGGKILMVSYLQ
jgi:hypothetical protein